jgi:hypothetical protein
MTACRARAQTFDDAMFAHPSGASRFNPMHEGVKIDAISHFLFVHCAILSMRVADPGRSATD